MHTSEEAISLLIQCDGNLNLAVAKSRLPKSDFLSLLSDTATLSILLEKMNALALLRVFDLFNKSALVAEAALADLEPKDAVKNFATLAQQIAAITDSPTTTNNINIADVTLKMLPPEIREAVINLTAIDAKKLPIPNKNE